MAMESPLGNLFLQVQNRITTQVPSVKWVDQNFGQLNNYDAAYRPPVNFPCALIDLSAIVFEDISNGTQNATARVIVTIGTAPLSNSNGKTPLPYREKAIEIYEIEHQLAKALHYWKPEGFTRLMRRNLDKQEREDAIRERLLIFEVSYTDTSGQPARQIVARPDAVIGGEIK